MRYGTKTSKGYQAVADSFTGHILKKVWVSQEIAAAALCFQASGYNKKMKETVKVKAIEALDSFRKNICAKKCIDKGIKKLFCYERMLKIITGFENYPVTYGQFIYSMRVKNKVCDLTEEEFKRKKNHEDDKEEIDEIAEERFFRSLESGPDEAELQDERLKLSEQEERKEFFLGRSEIDDYDGDGVYIGPDDDNLEIEKDEETGMYKLKR